MITKVGSTGRFVLYVDREGAMSAPVNVGDVLAGKYQIERVLGAGGMGVVMAARHLHLDERVAIKFLQPEVVGEKGIVARFMREGRAAAKIRSEHVARVYDVGALENGALYLVMEYLEGSDLAATVKQGGPLPIGAAVEYVLQACEAIAEAHAGGIVHRDIKPANLFLTARADGSPVVKVIDFGISKVSVGADAGMDITRTAEMRGSLMFMPPEQMSRPRDADPRSDIWAIGVSLYHLLTATYPFRAETMPQLCAKVFNEEPDPPRAFRAGIPVGLEAAILRCLMKEPSDRFASLAELGAGLVEFAGPEGRVSADRITRTLNGGRTTQRSRPEIDAEGFGTEARTAGAGAVPSQASVGRESGAPPSPDVPVHSRGEVRPTIQASTREQAPHSSRIEQGATTPLGISEPHVAAPSASSQMAGRPVEVQPALTQTTRPAWGTTGPTGSSKRSGWGMFIAGFSGVVTVLLVVGLALVLRRPDSASEVTSASSVADLQTSSAAVPAVPPPALNYDAAVSASGSSPVPAIKEDVGTAGPGTAPVPSATEAAKQAKSIGPAEGKKPTTAPTVEKPPPSASAKAPSPTPKKELFNSFL